MASNVIQWKRRVRRALLLASAACALAQSARVGSEIPRLDGQTLDNKPILLPAAAAGKVTLLLLGFSKKAGDRTGPWRERFVADFGSEPDPTYYVAAMIGGAPSLVRGMIRSGMRSGTPPSARAHVLTSAADETEWKKYLDVKDDSVPFVLLLDKTSHLRWSYSGTFDAGQYQALKNAVAAALGLPEQR